MFNLSHFYKYCKENNVDVLPFDGMPTEGVTMRLGSDYSIFLDFTKIQSIRAFNGVCCHELGHVSTGALHKVSSPYETVGRSEYRANRWVAEHILTEQDFRDAFAAGCTEPWQLADFFNLPEQDIKNALSYWTERREVDFSQNN